MSSSSVEIWGQQRREAAVRACFKWHGTPFAAHIAEPGVGIDCVNFLREVLAAAGVVERCVGLPHYDANHTTGRLKDTLKDCLHVDEFAPPAVFGDILILRAAGQGDHCGFFDGTYVWHAMHGRFVTHSQWKGLWEHRCLAILRLTAVGYRAAPTIA